MQKIKLYKWSLMLMVLISSSAFAQMPGDTRTPGIFGPEQPPRPTPMPDGSIRNPDGSILYPDGTIVFPDGTIQYPNGKTGTPQQQRQNRKPVYQNYPQYPQRNNSCNCPCNLPPGQAKKIYGGEARDYAHDKKGCRRGKYKNRNHDDGDDDDRDEQRGNNRNRNSDQQFPQQYPQYPQYPQTYPQQYPQTFPFPQYPQPQSYPKMKNRKS